MLLIFSLFGDTLVYRREGLVSSKAYPTIVIILTSQVQPPRFPSLNTAEQVIGVHDIDTWTSVLWAACDPLIRVTLLSCISKDRSKLSVKVVLFNKFNGLV